MAGIDLQSTTTSGDVIVNTGSTIGGISKSSLASNAAFSDTYATKAELAAVEAGEGNAPAGGTTGQVLAKNSDTSYDMEWIDLPSSGGGGGSSQLPGVTLESFTGASDNAKLGNAMTYCNAQAYPPTILLWQNRQYGSFTTQRTLYSGFAINGGVRQASIYRSAESTPNRIAVNTSGPWLQMPSTDTFDVSISNLSFYSQSSTCDFLGGHASGVMWTSMVDGCGFNLFRYVFGSPTTKLLLTLNLFDNLNINNSRGVSITWGGSDNVFFPRQGAIDSPTSITDAGNVPYHVWWDFMEKSICGPVFITCEGKPAGMRVTGNSSCCALEFFGLKVEGRNSSSSSYGSVIRHESGEATYNSCWLSYGYSAPGSSGRSSEGGVVSVLNGYAFFFNCKYARAGGDGVADTEPWIYAAGTAEVEITRCRRANDGGTFTTTGKPHVEEAGSSSIDPDSSVTVI